MTKVCVTCKKCDGRLTIVSRKGKDTLIKRSIARKDGRDKEFSSTCPVHVHSECRKQYTKPQLIKQAVKIAQQVSLRVTSLTDYIKPCLH